ncbi:protein arginine N-methyltransferase 5 [Stomoxys calcitrans]|uniref:protein arginine N-methyltransferase 5 n=1 Tax=Stomoxys calcitrans TaxID=35570 RepID=UPI0027E27E28|nr:protein arginine N-methyltransferase 5 [Stomoxys calcitrans]
MPYVCLLQEGNPNLPRFIEKAQQNNFSVVAAPLNLKELPLEFECEPLNEKHTQNTYSDLLLTADQWNTRVISILSESIDCDSSDEVVRKNSEEVLKRDISWAEHLQYGGYTMMRLKGPNNLNLARVLTNKIKGILLIHVPLYNSAVAQSSWRRDVSEEEILAKSESDDSWHWWNRFRWAADFNPKLRLVLELNEGDRPSIDIIQRWLGEPVEAIMIPSTMFIRNRHNYPVLPKNWQEILKLFMKSHANIIVSTDCGDTSLKLYSDYLTNFREMHKDVHILQSFEDVLEIPLQPLYDNLDSYTYEIFEKDPVKYKLYQDAIEAALKDRVQEDEIDNKLSIVMVLGAGRGPLARAALNAAERTGRKIRLYIIEKNPNAIRTLTAIARKLWHNKDVHIFSKDMREFSPPEPADILVSELLGSFGDNELSPECLDCAQKLLKPGGISIPYKSVSFINPIMSSKLYNAVRNVARLESFSRDKQATYQNHAENGFVVLLKNVYNIDYPKALFEFVHPNPDKHIDNTRYKVLKFEVQLDCVLTGIAGYFECWLYNDILMSINPMTHTPGMPSWFPMYFPFTEPMNMKKGQTIEIHFWRCVSKQKIWYEWCLASPITTHVHNLGGRSCPIYCT